MTRIVAGVAGGRRLAVPPGTRTRPTADRVREGLFSALGDLSGRTVLDLFAGSGALGLEALSRGAAAATMVEKDPRAVATIHANAEVVGLPGAHVVAAPVARFLAGTPTPFDVVLADPPYADPVDDLLAALASGWAADVVVIERAKRDPVPAWPPPLARWKERAYGDTVLLFGAVDHTSPASP
ncbi:MAG TPA: 16S rRNA (guanine(966)-N(2))-methyltransferase RsmD [Mycobacteriales bacterium]|nr:16S rRNA (guanine(966)-N(2))-methyltransferase RsmD [Mycobacteriales bacterium]